jgi:hypothetical protein
MAKKSKVQRTWYEQVFDSADFSAHSRAAIDIENEPKWVIKVLGELIQQGMPLIQIRKPKKLTPKEVGRCLGQICANLYAIGELMPSDSEALEKGQRIVEGLRKNQHVPSVQSALKAMEFAEQSILELASAMMRIEATMMESFKAALDQTSRVEAADFFRGFADGIAKPGMMHPPSLAGATTATPIYGKLLVHREEIKRLKSVRGLREFLLQRGLSEQVLGDPKRLEKNCGRIGLSFGGRGRKKRAN